MSQGEEEEEGNEVHLGLPCGRQKSDGLVAKCTENYDCVVESALLTSPSMILCESLYNNPGEREEVHFLAFDVAIFTGQYWSNFQTMFTLRLTPVS